MACAALLLGGCASVPPQLPAAEAIATAAPLSGRQALQVAAQPGEARGRSVALQFELAGNADAGQLALTTPLGTLAARARWAAGVAVLETPQGTRDFASLDDMAEQALGERLPLAALFDWLRGRPWPGAPSRPDGAGRFEQLDWQVDASQLASGSLQARRAGPPAVNLRVRLDG